MSKSRTVREVSELVVPTEVVEVAIALAQARADGWELVGHPIPQVASDGASVLVYRLERSKDFVPEPKPEPRRRWVSATAIDWSTWT